MLPGEPLARETSAGQTQTEVAWIAGQIADFMRDLHAIPVIELPPLPTADSLSDWADLFADFKVELFPYMRPDAGAAVTASFAEFLDPASDPGFASAPRHGDLGGENIRYDPATNQITGIVDFGSVPMGDPAVDLAAVSWYGEAFVDALTERYSVLADAGFRSRAAFYQSTHALQQAL